MSFLPRRREVRSKAAVNGEMGLTTPIVRRRKTVLNHWFRLQNMNDYRLNHRLFVAADKHKFKYENWCFQVCSKIIMCEHDLYVENNFCKSLQSQIIYDVQKSIFNEYKNLWTQTVNRDHDKRQSNGNKLGTFKKDQTESYVKCENISRDAKNAFAKFRCGTTLKRRFQGLHGEERVCFKYL